MRRKMALFLTMAMLFAFVVPFAATAQAASNYDWIRVKLSTQGATTLTIPVSGSYFIQENGKSFSNGTLMVSQMGNGIQVSHSSGGVLYSGASCKIMRENVSPSAGYLQIPTIYGNRKYLGHLYLKPTQAGIQAVNDVPLAHYLYGVVGYEMSNAFPLEALKAQAVVSKCYVLSGMKTSGEYYIGDTSSDQVYKGYDSSAANVIKAVDATLKVALKSGSSLLKTYYAASNGGETNLVSYAWSSSASNSGYGISLDDYDFENKSSLAESIYFPYGGGNLNSRLNAYLLIAASRATGMSVSSIVSINSVEAVSPRYSGVTRNMTKGRIQMTVAVTSAGTGGIGTGGTTGGGIIGGSTGGSSSGGIGVGGIGVGGFGFGNGFGLVGAGIGVGVGSGAGGSQSGGSSSGGSSVGSTINVSNASVLSTDGGQATIQFDFLLTDLLNNGVVTNSSLRIFWGERTSGGYTIYHVRYGHGVGMSQRGAQQRANSGQSFKTILKFYYPTASLSTITVNEPQNPEKPAVQLDPIAYGEINASGVKLRKGPSTKHAQIAKLKKNTDLIIFEKLDGWYYVQAGKYVGYVSSDYVTITQEVAPAQPDHGGSTGGNMGGATGGIGVGGNSSVGIGSGATGNTGSTGGIGVGVGAGSVSSGGNAGTGSAGQSQGTLLGRVTGSGVNFRTGPSTGSSVLFKLGKGASIVILETLDGWYYARYGSTEGYISADYVAIG